MHELFDTPSYIYAWDSNLLDEYKTRLSSPDITVIFDEARATLNNEQISSVHIDSGLNLIVEGIEASAKPLFSKSFKSVNEAHSFSENNLPWFDDECRIKRFFFSVFVSFIHV